MTALCPHCGHDLAADEIIERGEMRFDPRGKVEWRGKPVPLGPAKRIILGTLLKAAGQTISKAIIAERIGYEGDPKLIDVHLCHLRKALPGAPIETVWGVGVRWAA